jgi:hypothetical protein
MNKMYEQFYTYILHLFEKPKLFYQYLKKKKN